MVPGSHGVDPGARGRRTISLDVLAVSAVVPVGQVRAGSIACCWTAGASILVLAEGCSIVLQPVLTGRGMVSGTMLLDCAGKGLCQLCGCARTAAGLCSAPKKSPSSLCLGPLFCVGGDGRRLLSTLDCLDPRCTSVMTVSVARSYGPGPLSALVSPGQTCPPRLWSSTRLLPQV